MTTQQKTEVALQEVARLLKDAGFRVDSFGFRREQAQLERAQFLQDFNWEDVHTTDKRPFVEISCGAVREVDAVRHDAAQCLLDAGYRCFWSKVSLEGFHPQNPIAEATPDIMNASVEFHFLGGHIKQYTPEEIQSQLDNAEGRKQRAKGRREVKSLDNALRKQGLI